MSNKKNSHQKKKPSRSTELNLWDTNYYFAIIKFTERKRDGKEKESTQKANESTTGKLTKGNNHFLKNKKS